jgi:transposase-like protein
MTLGEQMRATTRKTFSAEFKHEAAQLVLDKNHTIIEAAKAMNVGKSTMGKWVAMFLITGNTALTQVNLDSNLGKIEDAAKK